MKRYPEYYDKREDLLHEIEDFRPGYLLHTQQREFLKLSRSNDG
jgi:hypothetical protein